jgi:RNA polymerase sigma-70 factor, ECF subfamily
MRTMPPEMTDEQIVRRALTDKEEFGILIDRYGDKLARYLSRLGLASKEDREDVLQNAFLKAYRNLNSFDPGLSFSSWMYRIAHNEAMSFFRARTARPTVTLGEDGERLLMEIKDEDADTSAVSDLRLSSVELAKALTQLAPKYRDALALRFFEERSYTEMSDILEVPVGTVSTLIHRAKRALHEALKDRIKL